MFHLHLFRTTAEEKIDIYYKQMTPMLQKVISIVKNEKPILSGTFEDEKILLEPEDIYYFDTVDRKTFAYTKDKICQISKSLSALEEELAPFGFVRINKANLVNIFMIIIQYMIAMGLVFLSIFLISLFSEIHVDAYKDAFTSFTWPYIIGAGFYYISLFRSAARQNKLLSEIQEKATKK